MLREHAARASAPARTDPVVAAVINRLTREFGEHAGPLTVGASTANGRCRPAIPATPQRPVVGAAEGWSGGEVSAPG